MQDFSLLWVNIFFQARQYFCKLDFSRIFQENKMIKIDQIDLKILGELQRDGRAAFTDIAWMLDVSEGTVRNRVNRMTKENILQFVGMIAHLI